MTDDEYAAMFRAGLKFARWTFIIGVEVGTTFGAVGLWKYAVVLVILFLIGWVLELRKAAHHRDAA